MDSKLYEIEGMTCEGCVGSVTRALEAAMPTTRIKVTLEGGWVMVEGDHEAEAVRATVEAAGFDFKGPVG